GEKNSVTIATNMAGRGTDIKLTEETKALGGLMVIGTERHESRRIDNQLRGRSGRQGDPGETQFCVSFEDDLMRRFGGDRFKTLLARVDLTGDLSLRLKPFAKFVENAQKKVEGNNFDTRKHLIEYDDVINKHREIAYKKRNLILDTPSVHEVIINTFKDYMNYLVYTHSSNNKMFENNLSELLESVNELFKDKIEITDVIDLNLHELEKYLNDKIEKQYEEKIKDVPEQVIKEIEKATSLRLIDMHWMTHINTMSHLIEGIGLRSYAQNNPLRAYTNEGYELLENMLDRIDKDITYFLIKSQINQVKSENPLQKIQTNQDLSKTKKSQPKKVEKIGRNEQCPCGSGKKYKQCCGR
ncbi:MAG: SEC-C metal-binding domain-containing protein, partial [Mycoplasmatota bacterium]